MLHKKRKPSTFTSSSGFADCKRNATSNNNMLHSKSTYFYRWFGSLRTGTYLVPTMCGVALFLGLGIITNPVVGEVDEASAATTNILTDSNLGTKVDLIMGDALNTSETVESGVVAYISNSFSVKVEGKADYHISVQAAEGYGSELTGRINKEKINGVGNKVSPANFSDNTWGYNLGLTNTTADTGAYIPYLPPEALAYSTLPVYGTLTAPTYSAADAKDQTDTYNLTFAAKITDYKPADHYETQALLSVVAEAKEIVKGFINPDTGHPIATMQEMTNDICTNASNKYSTQLVDDRSISGLGKITYWVTKLKDGKCWMTQNLDLPLKQGDILKPADTDVAADYTVSYLGDYHDPGTIYYKTTATPNYAPSSCGDPAKSGCASYFEAYTSTIDNDEKSHYLIGNYYPYTIATARKTADAQNSICPLNWKLPTLSDYNVATSLGNDTTGGKNIILEPYYFVPAGLHNGSNWESVAQRGVYWSSTAYNGGSDFAGVMNFAYHGVSAFNSNPQTIGTPIRCIAK